MNRSLLAGLLVLASSWRMDAATPTPLAELLLEAKRNNASISAVQHAWEAAKHVRKQATALPNPELTLQEFSVGSPKPFAGFTTSNFAYIGIGAAQELPYPGKLRLKGEVADRTADERQSQIAVVEAAVEDQLKSSYLTLASLQRTLRLLEASRSTLQQIVDTELSRYSTGQGSQFEVLKTQIEGTKLLAEITAHHEEMAEAEAQLKAVLHRPQESPDIVAEDLTPAIFRRTAKELLDLVHQHNPEVQLSSRAIATHTAELASAKRSGKPDFSVGYMYQRTGEDFPAYYMLTLNMTLQRKQRVNAEAEQAAELIKASEAELDSEVQKQLASVQKYFSSATSTAELLTEYRQGLMPQTETAFQSVMTAYGSGKQQFASVLMAFNETLDLQRVYERVLLEHETAIAHLETLTGLGLR